MTAWRTGFFFDLLFGLRDDPALPPDSFAFPGPLTRRIVHSLDEIALAPTAIYRYLAISRNVAGREDYFPPGAQVTVVHHPSDLPHSETGATIICLPRAVWITPSA